MQKVVGSNQHYRYISYISKSFEQKHTHLMSSHTVDILCLVLPHGHTDYRYITIIPYCVCSLTFYYPSYSGVHLEREKTNHNQTGQVDLAEGDLWVH